MNRKLRIVLFSILFLFLASFTSIKANSNVATMEEGARIRIAEGDKQQGLRFTAKLEGSSEAEHGFYLVFGKATQQQLLDVVNDAEPKLNGKEVFKVSVDGVNPQDKYSVVLTGIPVKGYLDNITVFSYVEDKIAEVPVTRSVGEVALRLKQLGEDNGAYDNIIDALNGVAEAAVYETGFDANEGFVVGTVYNNVDPNVQGPEDYKWSIIYGTPSVNQAISNGQSLQMRWYHTSPENLGSATATFKVSNITKVEFKARWNSGSDIALSVGYFQDQDDFESVEIIELTNSVATYEVVFDEALEDIYIKLLVSLEGVEAPTKRTDIIIDDLKFYANIESNALVFSEDNIENMLVPKGTKANLPILTKEGYRFLGWNTKEDGSGELVTNETVINKSYMLFPAYQKLAEYTVTFDLDGGSLEDLVSPQNVYEGETVDNPGLPTKDGFEFLGWYYTDGEQETIYAFSQAVESDITIFAKWKELGDDLFYFADFNDLEDIAYADIGYTFTNNLGDDIDWIIKEVFHSDGQNDKNMLRLRGANVAYLQTEKALENVLDISFDVKVYSGAHLDAVVQVYYLPVGEIQWISVGDEITFIDEDLFNVSVPVNKENVRIKIEVTEKTVNLDNLKIFGSHENEVQDPTFTVTFNASGGTPTPATQTLNIFDKLTIPNEPSKSGYTFMGWYESDDFQGNAWDFNADVMLNYNFTLYALFIAGQAERILYTTGFETSDGFSAETNYTGEKEKNGWTFNNGNVAGTGSADGLNVILRVAANTTNVATATYDTPLNITKISFNAKRQGAITLKVYFSVDGINWGEAIDGDITTTYSTTPYVFESNVEGAKYFKIETTAATSTSSKRDLNFDDFTIFGYE